MIQIPDDDRQLTAQTGGLVMTVAQWPVALRRGLLVLWDWLAWVLAVVLLLLVRYDFTLSTTQWSWLGVYLVAAMVLQLFVGIGLQVYLGRSRVGSFEEATWLGRVVAIVGLPLGVIFPLLSVHFPRGIGFVAPLVALVFIAMGRWLLRAIIDRVVTRSESEDGMPVLVYGAGYSGHDVAKLVDTSPEALYSIVGFLDDSPEKRFLRIGKYKVLGTGEDLKKAAEQTGAQAVIFAITAATPRMMQKVADECEKAGLRLIVVPSVRERIGGRVTLGSLREFNVADLLGRRPIETDLSAIADFVQGKVVLVTGAGGSIGS